MRAHRIAAVLALLVAGSVGDARAQQPAAGQGPPGQAVSQVTLVYEREVFSYRGQARRDPFEELSASGGMGPRFEELQLQAIIYETGRGRSVALLANSEGQIFRLRVGDAVGNSRVIEIGPYRVVMAVENFGAVRQEILELTKREGAGR